MRESALVDINIADQRGLEIGPLARPVVRKDQGRVFYVDHADRDDLREKYAKDENMRDLLDHIVEVDYVLESDQSLAKVAGPDGPFDYVIASHLIEHIPDIVGWFRDTATLLSPGGVLSLIVPDKRYTFDINRSVTEISQVIDAYLRGLTRPTYAQLYDFFSKAINGRVDPVAAWAGTTDYSGIVRRDYDNPDVAAFEYCQGAGRSGDFVDIHCHAFTPESFLLILEKLIHLDLFPYQISSVFPTEVNDIEFFVSLRLMPDDQEPRARKELQLRSIAEARSVLAGGWNLPTDLAVSELERKAILTKRQTMRWIRARQDHRRPRSKGSN
jgi:SAM-dependent methyltransferase